MITATERAAVDLREVLTARGARPGEGMKIVRGPSDRFGLTIGLATDGDEVVRVDDAPLLIVDESVAPELDGAVLDIGDMPGDRPRLTVKFPGAAVG
jgi:hypothetical protein